MSNDQHYQRGQKLFKFQFQLSGDPVADKTKMLLAFQKAVDNYFAGPKPKSYTYYSEPERF